MEDVGGSKANTSGTNSSSVKQYKVGDVTKVELIGPGTVEIRRGAAGVLTLTASPADHEKLEIKANGDSLKVSYAGGMLRNKTPQSPLTYDLAIPVLEELKISDGLSGQLVNPESRDLKVDLQDGATLTINALKANDFHAKLSDASRLIANGVVEKQKIELSDGSIYTGAEVESTEADVVASDGSQAHIRCTNKLKVKASDGSVITYSGEKLDLDVKTEDGSTFRRVDG